MSKNYRTYTEEFKLEALELLRTSGKRILAWDMTKSRANWRS